MHPLIASYVRLHDLNAVKPRLHGAYLPMWRRMMADELEFIMELRGVENVERIIGAEGP
jgi:hypothetical protein